MALSRFFMSLLMLASTSDLMYPQRKKLYEFKFGSLASIPVHDILDCLGVVRIANNPLHTGELRVPKSQGRNCDQTSLNQD